LLQRDDTIFATVTGQGRAGVAIVRISGPLALHTLNRLCPPGAPPHATLQLRHLLDPFTGTILDEALVAAFFPPRSYTGERVVELNIHGNPVRAGLVENPQDWQFGSARRVQTLDGMWHTPFARLK